MNKPLKNSEWKSNHASSYYWITRWWQPEADLSCDSTLSLHAAVGAGCSCGRTPFSTWVSVSLWLLAVIDACGPFYRLEHQKTWLGHLSNLLTLQGRRYSLLGTFRTPARQGARPEGRWGQADLPTGSWWGVKAQPASVFFWKRGREFILSDPCHSWWCVCRGRDTATIPQSLLCSESTEYSSPGHIQASKQNANHSRPAPAPAYLRKLWSPRKWTGCTSWLRPPSLREERGPEVLAPPEDWSGHARKGWRGGYRRSPKLRGRPPAPSKWRALSSFGAACMHS